MVFLSLLEGRQCRGHARKNAAERTAALFWRMI